MGDAFNRYYKKILNEYYSQKENYEIYCADLKTERWTEKQEAIKNEILAKGYNFVDVANLDDKRVNNSEFFSQWVKNQKFDLILIGTPDKNHIESILEWLASDFSLLIVEKPFSDKSSKIDTLYLEDPNKLEKIAGFSHVRAKLHKGFGNEKFLSEIFTKIGRLKKFRFFYLEDYSGTDTEHIQKCIDKGEVIDTNINCPVAMYGRADALKKGIVFDLGIHMLSVLDYFGNPTTLDIDRIWAGKYLGVNNNDNQELNIDGETFAAIDFSFQGHGGGIIEGQTFLGKGVLGIDELNDFKLYLEKSELREVKLLELEGDLGKIQFFFTRRERSEQIRMIRLFSDKGRLIDSNDVKFSVEEKPYKYIFKEALKEPEPGKAEDKKENLFFSVKAAQSHLIVLEEIKKRIEEGVRKRGDEYPRYYLGKRVNGEIIRQCETLDKVLARLEPPIWKKLES